MTPQVSVIVPVYNTSLYLEECLNSLCNQSLQDIEIICVDDCSTDNSFEILSQYAKQDKRIKIERHLHNRGIGGARNTGVRNSTAPLIASIDSDDFVTQFMIERLYTTLHEDESDIAACGRIEINESGDYIRHVSPLRQLISLDDSNLNLFRVTDPSFVQKIWKKKFFTEYNIYFDEQVLYEDLGWTYRALMRANKISVTGEAHYHYRIRKHSSTHSYGIRNLADHVKAFNLIRKDMIDLGLYKSQENYYKQQIIDSLIYHAKSIQGFNNNDLEHSNYISLIYIISRFLIDSDGRAMSFFEMVGQQNIPLDDALRSEFDNDAKLKRIATIENALFDLISDLENESLLDIINLLINKVFKSQNIEDKELLKRRAKISQLIHEIRNHILI